jgi:hypothetical protein
MATPPKTLGERKFKDRCIVDAPSVDEYRARQAELAAEGVTDYPLMLECLGLKGRALEVAVQERLPYEDALALGQAWGALDVSAVWGPLNRSVSGKVPQ